MIPRSEALRDRITYAKRLKEAASRTSMEICRSQLDLTKLAHTNCVQFGREALLIADESDWNQIVNSATVPGCWRNFVKRISPSPRLPFLRVWSNVVG